MKAILAILVFASCIASAADDDIAKIRQLATSQWERVQANFRIVQSLDTQDHKSAVALFAKVRTKDGAVDDIVGRQLLERNYSSARDWLNREVNGWIINEAAHAQYPALSVLFNNPARLKWLQHIAAHRKKFPSTSLSAKKSDALVADILAKAIERNN